MFSLATSIMYHILSLLLAPLLMVNRASAIIYECGNSSSLSYDWDYLAYTQQWPTSFCLAQPESEKKKCHIPPDVTSWIIHGLWPSAARSGKNPEFCYPPQIFNDSSIKSLIPQLNHTWPNLIEEYPYTVLWQHEWCKHGTCALNCQELKGQLNYFKIALALHDKLSIDSALESENIIPGKSYPLLNITNALSKEFNVKTRVLCEVVGDQTILLEIKVCMDKNFNLIDCPGSTATQSNSLYYSLGTCSSKKDIFYPPLNKYIIQI